MTHNSETFNFHGSKMLLQEVKRQGRWIWIGTGTKKLIMGRLKRVQWRPEVSRRCPSAGLFSTLALETWSITEPRGSGILLGFCPVSNRHLLVSTSSSLGLQIPDNLAFSVGPGDWTWDLMSVQQALFWLSHLPSHAGRHDSPCLWIQCSESWSRRIRGKDCYRVGPCLLVKGSCS